MKFKKYLIKAIVCAFASVFLSSCNESDNVYFEILMPQEITAPLEDVSAPTSANTEHFPCCPPPNIP